MAVSNTALPLSKSEVGGLAARRIKLLIMLVVAVGVWDYARFPDTLMAVRAAPPTVAPFAEVGAFPQPEIFAASPQQGKRHIHVRSGPGFNYPSVDTLDQGTEVTGIARTGDADGAPWIQLTGDHRFAKESVLTFVRMQPQ